MHTGMDNGALLLSMASLGAHQGPETQQAPKMTIHRKKWGGNDKQAEELKEWGSPNPKKPSPTRPKSSSTSGAPDVPPGLRFPVGFGAVECMESLVMNSGSTSTISPNVFQIKSSSDSFSFPFPLVPVSPLRSPWSWD